MGLSRVRTYGHVILPQAIRIVVPPLGNTFVGLLKGATIMAVIAVPDMVFLANERCHQENLIDQLKHGVGATRMPVDTLLSNWAYRGMAALAWTLKAWFALRLPETGRWATRYAAEKGAVRRMEFKAFVEAFMRVIYEFPFGDLAPVASGDRVCLSVPPGRLHFFDAETEAAIAA